MEKYALSLMVKISLFSLLMPIVAKTVPYDDLVNSFVIRHVNYDSASFIGELVLGETDPEPYESVVFYIDIMLNTLICVPLLSLIISVYNAFKRKFRLIELITDCGISTLRRLVKLLSFTFLFCALLRFLPYQLLPSAEAYSAITTASVVALNLILTIFCYWFITKKITVKGRM